MEMECTLSRSMNQASVSHVTSAGVKMAPRMLVEVKYDRARLWVTCSEDHPIPLVVL